MFNPCVSVFLAVLCYVFLDNCRIGSSGSTSQCSGCNSVYSPDCIELNGQIFGCYGEFSGGLRGSEASSICGTRYHICDSADEASDLGLSIEMCEVSVPTDHVFFSLESSAGNWLCNSEYGTNGVNDVWGCAGAETNIATCNNPELSPSCGPFNFACGEFGSEFDSWSFCGSFAECHEFEQSVMSITDDNKAGVLCCVDDDYYVSTSSEPSQSPTEEPTEAVSSCTEYIDISAIDTCVGESMPELEQMYADRYYYYGLDSENMPEYISEGGLGRITLDRMSSGESAPLVLKIELDGYGDRYQTDATISELIDESNYELSETNVLDGSNTYVWASDSGTDVSLNIVADLHDCGGIGLDIVDELLDS